MLGIFLLQLGMRAGYQDRLLAYNFRRGQAQKLDGGHVSLVSFVDADRAVIEHARSIAQRKAVMGHSSEAQFNAYYSHNVDLDTQSAFLDHPLQPKLIQTRTGMAAHRDLRAPQPPLRLLTNSQMKTFRLQYDNYFKEQAQRDLTVQIGTPELDIQTANHVQEYRLRPSRLLRAELRYNKTRKNAIDVLFASDSSGLAQVVDCLTQLSKDEETFYSYPGVPGPVDGRCHYCHKAVDRKSKLHLLHLLECHESQLFQQRQTSALAPRAANLKEKRSDDRWFSRLSRLIAQSDTHWNEGGSECIWLGCGQNFPGSKVMLDHLRQEHLSLAPRNESSSTLFCHECAEWIPSPVDWERHCQDHLQNLTLFCGRLTWRGRIIIAPNCPFCLSNSNLSSADRCRQFRDNTELRRHVEEHVTNEFNAPQQCPHPLCNETIELVSALHGHLAEVHSMPLNGVAPLVTPQK